MAAYYTGEGSTIAFANVDSNVTRTANNASSAVTLDQRTYCVRSMSLPAFEREKIDVSCLDSDGFKEYMASYLAEPGDLEVVCRFDGVIGLELDHLGYQGAAQSPPNGTTEMKVTLTFDLLDGQATAATLTGSCFIKGVNLSELNGTSLVEMTLSVCLDGRYGPIFSEATWTP